MKSRLKGVAVTSSPHPLPTDEITEHCGARGLTVDSVSRRGTVLVLHPRKGVPLPDASELSALAAELDIEGIRYVTLAVDEYATGDRT